VLGAVITLTTLPETKGKSRKEGDWWAMAEEVFHTD
jgi:hypothetical protein